MGRLFDARSRAFDAAEVRHKLCERLPYPLDHDTARAVAAALRHRVVTWAQFEEDGYLQDWVAGAYAHEGKLLEAGALDRGSACLHGPSLPWRRAAAVPGGHRGVGPDAPVPALVGSLFNEHVATPLQQLTAADAAVELGDNDALAALIAERSAYLVDRAKAETLHLWQDDDRAATLMKQWV